MNTNKSDNESRRLIQNQSFLNIDSLRQSFNRWFTGISFVNCNFENIYFGGEFFGSCSFQNCTFNDFGARKGQFRNCYFEGCLIKNCDMSRAEFDDTNFKNCEFLGVDLAASYFTNCKLETTRFLKSNLDHIGVDDVKVWKSKEWVEIEDFSSFQKHLDNSELNNQ